MAWEGEDLLYFSSFYHITSTIQVNSTSTHKFIISSVPFTTLWNGDAQVDSWAGYQFERTSILDAVSSVPNTFILSGDRHEFAAIRHLGLYAGEAIEISTSPLNMFWLPIPSWLKIRNFSTRYVIRREFDSFNNYSWLPEETLINYVPKGQHKW